MRARTRPIVLATARRSPRVHATSSTSERAPAPRVMRAKDVLATLGDAMQRGRVAALTGNVDERNRVQSLALREILAADLVRVDARAIAALRRGAEACERATDGNGRWDALRTSYDEAMRALLASEGDADFALADTTFDSGDVRGSGTFERVMTFEGATSDAGRWRSLNDGVMGGVSDGWFVRRDDNSGASFIGNVSLDYNGGFASVRAYVEESGDAFDGVYLDAKSPTGEEKTFLFILKDEDCLRDQTNYKVSFKVGSDFGRVKIPFAAFCRAERMGRVVLREPLRLNRLREFGLMILKGEPQQVGPFELQVKEIGFYRGD